MAMTAQEHLAKIKEVYDDKEAIINGRVYKFLKTNHKKRLRVFSHFTSIQDELVNNNMEFLGRDSWELIENTIMGVVSYEDEALSKRADHWEEFPGDYILFITMALSVISYPFLAGSVTS
jgi:hypothetical protein